MPGEDIHSGNAITVYTAFFFFILAFFASDLGRGSTTYLFTLDFFLVL